MSTGYPFSTLIGNNVLDQILSPKIVGSTGSGYQVKLDLGNIDTLYANIIGSPTNRVSTVYGVTLNYQYLDPPVTGGGGTGITGPTGATGPGGTGPAGPAGPTGATGSLVTVTVDEEIDTLDPGVTGYVFNDSTNPSVVNLVFGLPRGATGPPGPGGGSGSQSIQGPVGNVLFFGATGVTSANTFNFSSGTLTVPTEIVTQSGNTGQIRLTTAGGTSFLQSGSSSNNNEGNTLSVGRLNSGLDLSTVQINTQAYQVAIGKGNTGSSSSDNPTLDVNGRTILHVAPGNTVSGGIVGAPINVTTPSSVGTPLPAATYRIYAWGEGGTGPNALAGGSIQFDATVPTGGQQLTYGITGAGPTTGLPGYVGGNGLFVTLGALTYWAYGGGGGSSVTTGGAGTSALGGTPGQGGSVSSGSGGTGGIFEYAAGGGTYIFNGDLAGSTFTTAITTPDFFDFPAGTTFTFPTLIPIQNQFVNIPMPANSTIRIDLPDGGFSSLNGTGSISGIPVPGFGTQYYATTTTNNVPIVIPAGATGITGTTLSGNGQGATAGSNINVTGSSIQLLSRTPTLTTLSATLRGASSVTFPTAGNISFGTTGAIEFAGITIVLTEAMRVDFGPGALTADTITAVISQNVAVGFPNYGAVSIAGSGTSVRGGSGLNGGGGGGGYFGGGGGNQNIGGNGSSFLPPGTVNGADNALNQSVVPYGNQFGTYGAPRTLGGWIVIESRTASSLALGVTGDVVITGNETVGGQLTVTNSIQGNSNIQTLANLLVNGGIFGTNSTTQPTFPLGLNTQGAVALGSSGQATQSGIQVFGNMNVSASAGGGGNITATATITGNDVVASSDRRLKHNIVTVDSALQKVLHLRGVYFTKTGSEKRNVGVIAQEVEEVLPEVVHTDSDGMKSVAYGNIIGLLIEAIKELRQKTM
jgi:hypothetical protein